MSRVLVVACFFVFSGVGFLSVCWWSLCCFLMRLKVLFLIHGCLCFLCFFGLVWNDSIVCWSVSMSVWKVSSIGVSVVGTSLMAFWMAVLMFFWFFWYALLESVCCWFGCSWCGFVEKIVYIGK